MHTKMAGGDLPLQEMIARHISQSQSARFAVKTAASEEKAEEKKEGKKHERKETKAFEKKEDAKEESTEKTAGFDSLDGLYKFAHALQVVGEKIASDLNGGESVGGGEQIPVNKVTPGTQQYKKDGTKKFKVPASTPLETPGDSAGQTATQTHVSGAPGGAQGQVKSASRDFLLQKIAEAQGGGMTLDSASGQNVSVPKPASGGNSARAGIGSNEAAINFTKGKAKAPQKSQLAQVLAEPAFSGSSDTKLQENLSNTGKAGVKLASAARRALLEKIANDPNHPAHAKMVAVLSRGA